ncbi:MAG: hypothetical protein LRZ84_18730 [Desertifilum sp.]|nr:hypothetical protein [Desertifilum sp.]
MSLIGRVANCCSRATVISCRKRSPSAVGGISLRAIAPGGELWLDRCFWDRSDRSYPGFWLNRIDGQLQRQSTDIRKHDAQAYASFIHSHLLTQPEQSKA